MVVSCWSAVASSCSLVVVRCVLLFGWCFMLSWSLCVVRCVLLVVCRCVFGVYRLRVVGSVRCSLRVVCCLLLVIGCVLRVVCRLSCVVCCLMDNRCCCLFDWLRVGLLCVGLLCVVCCYVLFVVC